MILVDNFIFDRCIRVESFSTYHIQLIETRRKQYISFPLQKKLFSERRQWYTPRTPHFETLSHFTPKNKILPLSLMLHALHTHAARSTKSS